MLTLLVITFITAQSYSVNSQDVVGCGGFVQSSIPIKFDKVQVKLYTKQGAFKTATECAPNNGYFLVAIYDKGEYVLRINPPQGWAFSPLEIPLSVDGVTDPCSKGEDLNFEFTGFSIDGKVGSIGRNQGPSGITVTLIGEGEAEKSTLTDEVGGFHFGNVMPGKYLIKALHPTWVFKHDQIDVAIVDDNVVVTDKIVIAGYDVKGYVQSGGEAIQDVSFILLSKNSKREDIMKYCNEVPKNILGSIKREGAEEALCLATSKTDGSFSFPTVPSGDYVLIPYYEAHGITFDILPQKLSFSVNYRSVEFKTPFQVYGFSIRGKVVNQKDVGIEGVVVKATNTQTKEERSALSGIDGHFVLENVTTGQYDFKMEKEHYFFEDEKIHISPNTPTLKDIVVKEYHLCGEIHITNVLAGALPINKHKVLLQPVSTQNTKIRTEQPDKDGNFCFRVIPGKYKVEVPLSESEQQLGLLLKPASLDVSVDTSPVLNLIFEQFKATVRGRVECIEDCSDISVHLSPVNQPNEKTYAQIDGNGKEITFTFSDIVPGVYKVTPQRKKWCWTPANVEVTIKDADVSNIKLVHSGYYLKCTISHNITLDFRLENSKENIGSFELKQGSNQFCLKTPGTYSLTPKSCYRFEKETYSYNTAKPESLTLAVDSYKAIVRINTLKEVTSLKTVVKSTSTNKEEILSPTLVNNISNTSFIYESIFWGGLAEEFTIMPLSKEILFYPETKSTVISENCPGSLVEFQGREGIFIEGQITPPFASVSVTITTYATSEYEGDVVEVLTDDNGKYRVGPVHSDMKYDVIAIKEGYHITPQPNNKGSFLAQKLAHITVKVADETGAPMSSVLLSLSGGHYRNNNLTLEDGSFSFFNLGPGQYYLRPMQKEYNFNPNSKMIDVAEGEDLIVTIEGKRVAFSCSGNVASLSGIPEDNVAIEAVGLHKCSEFHESTVSDQSGYYKLRGLQPGCSYNIRLIKSETNSKLERLAPSNQVIFIQQNDVNGVNFVVFEKPTKFYLTAYIDTDFEYLPSLKVLLYAEDDMDSPLHVIIPSVLKYIEFPPLKPKTYIVKLQSTLSMKTHETRSTSATVVPDGDYSKKHVKLKFEATERKVDLEPTQSVIALPLAIALVFLAYNYDSVLVLLVKLNSIIQNFNNKESSDTESDQDEDSSRSSKKKRR